MKSDTSSETPEKKTDNSSEMTDEDDEELDPRIKSELERLNAATDGINHLETEFGEAQALFQQMMHDATFYLKASHQKLGKSVDKSRPYYEALKLAKYSHSELHEAALRFEQAQSRHYNAKKRVSDAERIVFSSVERKLDPALQELLNQATVEVMEAAKQSQNARALHWHASLEFEKNNKAVNDFFLSLKRNVIKSRPYFDLKSNLNNQLEMQKKRLEKVQEGLLITKKAYSETLHSLEMISDDIHKSRKNKHRALEMRGEGVGADWNPEETLSHSKTMEEINSQVLHDDSVVCSNLEGESEGEEDTITKEEFCATMEYHPDIAMKIKVSKTLSEQCTDPTYEIITSHSILCAPPPLDYVDMKTRPYKTFSHLNDRCYSFSDSDLPSLKDRFKDSFRSRSLTDTSMLNKRKSRK